MSSANKPLSFRPWLSVKSFFAVSSVSHCEIDENNDSTSNYTIILMFPTAKPFSLLWKYFAELILIGDTSVSGLRIVDIYFFNPSIGVLRSAFAMFVDRSWFNALAVIFFCCGSLSTNLLVEFFIYSAGCHCSQDMYCVLTRFPLCQLSTSPSFICLLDDKINAIPVIFSSDHLLECASSWKFKTRVNLWKVKGGSPV